MTTEEKCNATGGPKSSCLDCADSEPCPASVPLVGAADINRALETMPKNQPEPIMRFFKYAHLPVQLAIISRPFCDLACRLVATLPRNAERTVALRKLLEAKDAAVRASLPEEAP